MISHYLLRLSSVAVLAFGLTTVVQAQDKSALTSSDVSVKKSERKAILGITHLGLESKKYSFPVYYTPAGKNAKTRMVGTWNVQITQDFADDMLAKQYPILISNRYDKMLFDRSQATIISPAKDITSDLGGVQEFSFQTGGYESFKKSLNAYLNEQIAAKMTDVLSSASQERYKNMEASKQASFINTKAKESGIPAPILEKLISSSYVFAAYMPKLQGKITISQVEHKSKNRGTYYTYSTSFSMPIDTNLAVFKFDGKAFSLYSELDAKPGFDPMAALAKSISGSKSVSTKFMPNKGHAQKLFDDVLANALKDNVIALNTRLKSDRAFAITAPLEEVQSGTATLNIGVQEDIRTDHPMFIVRTVDGKEKHVGMMKVRQAGANCALEKPQNMTLTKASIIHGSAEMMDLGVEHPWTGVYGSIGYATVSGGYDFTNAVVSSTGASGSLTELKNGDGSTGMVTVDFNGDLGYILNSQALSEIWMNVGMGFGGANSTSLPATIFYTGYGTASSQGENGVALKATVALEKRIYPVSNIQLGLGADFGIDMASFGYSDITHSSKTYSTSLSMTNIHVVPRVKALWTPNLNLEIFASVGWNVSLATATSFRLSDGDSETEDPDSMMIDNVARNQGLAMHFGVAYHIDFAGPFAKMFAKPSTRCDKLKKAQNN